MRLGRTIIAAIIAGCVVMLADWGVQSAAGPVAGLVAALLLPCMAIPAAIWWVNR